MASITIRRLDEKLKVKLRLQAARHGHSMEEEVRSILRVHLKAEADDDLNLVESIRRRIAPLGGVDLPIPPREMGREPPDFSRLKLKRPQRPRKGRDKS
jgi:plasmid stability protein